MLLDSILPQHVSRAPIEVTGRTTVTLERNSAAGSTAGINRISNTQQ